MNIIKIKRPNGKIEEVDLTSKFPAITKATYEKLVRMNREAGRGEVLGFVRGGIIEPTGEKMTKVEWKEECRRNRQFIAKATTRELDENVRDYGRIFR